MMKKLIGIIMLCFTPLMAQAWGLNYRLMNSSSATVYFSSTSWWDWGFRVSQGQTRENFYWFSPKKMYLTLSNYDGSRFSLTTTSGCDMLGLPPLQQPNKMFYQVKGHKVTMHSGTVDIVISDLPGSTYYNKRIGCSLVAS